MSKKLLRMLGACCAALLALTCAAFGASVEAMRPMTLPMTRKGHSEFTDRIIIRMKNDSLADKRQAMAVSRARTLSAHAGTLLIPVRPAGDQAQVVRLTHAMPLAEVEKIADKLAQEPSVMYAEPDRRKYPQRVPSDQNFSRQWYLFEPVGGINAPGAWDVTTGSPSIVVAVIDTGVILENPDLQGRLLPGYDFIGSDDGSSMDRSAGDFGTVFATANDRDGRDPDASDPGDWVDANDKAGFFNNTDHPDCRIDDSDWHGIHVTGIIAASANNNFGIAGVDWNANILPVRVLGKCGGYTSDIMDGARWAAGITVLGANNQPVTNPTPAQVLNLSLGGPSSGCSQFEQNAINEIIATGRVKAIVTSAGNEGEDASKNSPGNCNGVINVGATDRNGNRPGYSDFGAFITVSAPGGFIGPPSSIETGENGILSLFNCGTTGAIVVAANCPDPTDITRSGSPHILAFFSGTSAAAPQVSGTVSLMLSVNPTLSAADVRDILITGARAFPAGSNCTASQCGAGILNANAAVRLAAARPGGSAASPPSTGGGGGGGGGCTMGSGPADAGLPLLMLMALLGLGFARRPPQIKYPG